MSSEMANVPLSKRPLGWYYAMTVAACSSIGTLFGAFKGKNFLHVTKENPKQAYRRNGLLSAIANTGTGAITGLASGFLFGSLIVPFAATGVMMGAWGCIFHLEALSGLYHTVRRRRGMPDTSESSE